MPLGAARLNTLSRVLAVAAADNTQAHRELVGIDVQGNSVVSTTQAKFGGTSLYFDGNGDAVSCDPRDLQIGSGDFTIEFFYYPTSLTSGSRLILECRDNNTDPNRINWYFDSATTYRFRQGSTTILSGAHGLSTGQWYHLAIVRSSGTIKFYRDGTEIHSASDSTTYASDNFIIGQYFGGGNFGLIGYVDEFRVSSTARYTGAFTPTTTPFINDIDTDLLIHSDGTNNSTTVIDDGGERLRFGISANSTADIERTANAKFGASAMSFDPTGGTTYLTATDPGDVLAVGTGDVTYEGWFRTDNVATLQGLFATGGDNNLAGNFADLLLYSNVLQLWYNGNIRITGTTTLSSNTWHHCALVRNGGDWEIFLDGSSEGTYTANDSLTSNDTFRIGRSSDASYGFDGYIDEIRVSDTARYTTSFSVPTERFVSDENTLMLVHGLGTNGSQNFYDDNAETRAPLSVAAIANASYNDTYSKFGRTSIYMDGTGDYIFAREQTGKLSFGTDDFTIEWFQYLPSLNFNAVDLRDGSNGAKILLYSNPTDKYFLWVNSANRIDSGSVLTAGAWQHIALCRNSGNTRLYVDGTQAGSTYADSTNYQHNSIYIFYNSLSSAYDGNGYLNEFRISDTARYSGSSLTVPTEPFKNDSNTRLLIHGQGTQGNNHLFDDNSAFTQ